MNNAPIFECSVAICDLQPTEEALYVPDCIRSGNVQSRLASYIGCHHTYGDFSPNSLVTTTGCSCLLCYREVLHRDAC